MSFQEIDDYGDKYFTHPFIPLIWRILLFINKLHQKSVAVVLMRQIFMHIPQLDKYR